MTNLILSSNFSGNKLFGVGEATLQNETIKIIAEPDTTVTLLRGVNKVALLKANNEQLVTSGSVLLNDVYTLENNDNKLIIKVENEDVRHETDIFINPDPIIDATSSKRKTTLTTGVIILFLLVVSVMFGLKQKNLNDFNLKSEVKLNLAIQNFEMRTRESFIKAQEAATELKKDGYKSESLDELLKKIDESESELLGETKVSPSELLDLTLQINGFNGNLMSVTGKTIFIYDEKDKNIIKLDTNGKSASIVAKKELLENVKGIGSYDDRLFTLNSDGIYEIGAEKNKLKDLDWGESIFYLYSSNIYMLDKGNNKIYRFSGNGKTFGDKSDWLAPGIEADFSKVVDMTIDGSIWVITSSGKIIKYTNGNPSQISLNGIVNQLENPTAIYSNEDLKYVYILDKDNGRVVVLEKNGKFKLQYVSDQIKNATDLVVDEVDPSKDEEGKIILLSGSKLIYFDPK